MDYNSTKKQNQDLQDISNTIFPDSTQGKVTINLKTDSRFQSNHRINSVEQSEFHIEDSEVEKIDPPKIKISSGVENTPIHSPKLFPK